MSKKKMCKYWGKANCSVDQFDKNYEKYRYVSVECPKNVDNGCQIVPPKKKLVKVKAWAIVFDDGTPLEAHTKRYSDRLCGMNVIPCTIVIDSKYTKGRKK